MGAACRSLVLVAAALWVPRLAGPARSPLRRGRVLYPGHLARRGRGYRLLNEPGAIEAIQYPPVLPAVAAVHQRVLGTERPSGRGTRAPRSLSRALPRLRRRGVRPGSAISAAAGSRSLGGTARRSQRPDPLSLRLFVADLPYRRGRPPFYWWRQRASGQLVGARGRGGLRAAHRRAWPCSPPGRRESLLRRRWRQAAVRARVGAGGVRQLAGVRPPASSRARVLARPRTPISERITSSTTWTTRTTWLRGPLPSRARASSSRGRAGRGSPRNLTRDSRRPSASRSTLQRGWWRAKSRIRQRLAGGTLAGVDGRVRW